mmetsp:Transcript_69707/g.130105  ORF Transcript_69707/g.130105 Transcript_69707/m.130105 type:complete len:240 (-) Transcript_69707:68-787(-)
METEPLAAGKRLTKDTAIEIRLGFVKKVYAILTTQLLATVVIAAPIVYAGKDFVAANPWIFWVGLVIKISALCVTHCARETMRTFPQNYAVLSVLTVGMSMVVGYISALYTWQSILLAAGLTSLVFCGLTIYAWNTKRDFTGMWPYLFAFSLALLSLGLTILVLSLCGVQVQWLIMLYNFLGVVLFSFYIVFDTQMILGEYGGKENSFCIDDYCLAAIELYVDVVQLFLFILRLTGDRK